MYLLALIFPLSVLVAIAVTAVCWFQSGYRAPATQRSWVLLLGLGLSYLGGWVWVSIDPYFIDNGVVQFIEWRFRWGWAMLFASVLQWVFAPAALVVHHRWIQRNLPARHEHTDTSSP